MAELTKKIRVYDKRDGDFIIEVPEDAKVTFGYFNPALAGRKDMEFGERNVGKQTALRIYSGKTEKSNQIACFVGVDGFRDESIGLTKMKEAVTIIRQFEDDAEGNIEESFKRNGVMKAIPEGRFN